jgi:protein gp37
MGNPKYQQDGDPLRSGPGFGLTLHHDALLLPHRWRQPRKIFVNSMSDLFHESVPFEFIERVFEVMRSTPRHTYQVLTKRSKRLAAIGDSLPWPENVWMGVSVESARYRFRIDHLRQSSAKTRFLSIEPLIAATGKLNLEDIDWVIVGGESGASARPMKLEWVEEIQEQCANRGVPFFFKQWGGRTPKAGGRTLNGRTYDEYPSEEKVKSA